MTGRVFSLCLWFLALASLLQGSEAIQEAVPREFRGAWVASVYNLDWPSRPGLPVEEQKRELCVLLDEAKALNLNAIILQVRPAADALYESPYEPWSYYLTGKMGKAPEPFYDPLAYAVEQAHLRCLELHAWINPYRARAGLDYAASPDHVLKRHPEWIRTYRNLQWLDPGLPEVQEHVLKVVKDIVRRYDIDGLHIDDYFYPYPLYDKAKKKLEFPDEKTYRSYRDKGGTLGKDDWRRDNVNAMVKGMYETIRKEKPWVKFGVSPFGIWKPGVPAGTMAYVDACEHLYADSRRWLQEGWLDYCAPQLYWSRDSKLQPFEPLLTWWALQNSKSRHLWPGIASERVGAQRRPDEMVGQIMLTRLRLESGGHIHWNMKPLLNNHLGLGTLLKKKVYEQPALVPESPWMVPDKQPVPSFIAGKKVESGQWRVSWVMAPESLPPFCWIWREKQEGVWTFQILPGTVRSFSQNGAGVSEIQIAAVDRYGRISSWQKVEVAPWQAQTTR